MRELSAEALALWRALEVANTKGSGKTRVVPLLVELARVAPERSEAWAFAHRELASHLLADDPWRASICARRLLDHAPRDAAAWGILGLTQSLLGNHEYAVRCYREALRFDPSNPWYAHNLGHLLDVACDRPRAARPLLERALARLADWPEATPRHHVEVTASLAHALMRVGELDAALVHVRRVIRSGMATQGHHELHRVIDERLEARLEAHMRTLPRAAGSGRAVRVRRRTTASTRPDPQRSTPALERPATRPRDTPAPSKPLGRPTSN